jgi:hypothetical protein
LLPVVVVVVGLHLGVSAFMLVVVEEVVVIEIFLRHP